MNAHFSLEKIGIKVGFLMSYVLFSLIFFSTLTFLGKMSGTWRSLVAACAVTLAIVILGGLIKKFVK